MLVIIYIISSFAAWTLISYAVFYFTYADTSKINQIYKENKENKEKITQLEEENKELKEQNKYLKNQIQEYLRKNEDLSKVVWEMSRYAYAIRKAWEKSKELLDILSVYDDNLLSRIEEIAEEKKQQNKNQKESDNQTQNAEEDSKIKDRDYIWEKLAWNKKFF